MILSCIEYVTECGSPLGVADDNIIRDDQMSASSETGGHKPEDGRLNGGKAWRPEGTVSDVGEWIQVMFDSLVNVTAIATQGRNSDDGGGGDNDWVTQYKVRYSNDGQIWNYITDADETANIMVNILF